jgi:hypothetical protein
MRDDWWLLVLDFGSIEELLWAHENGSGLWVSGNSFDIVTLTSSKSTPANCPPATESNFEKTYLEKSAPITLLIPV